MSNVKKFQRFITTDGEQHFMAEVAQSWQSRLDLIEAVKESGYFTGLNPQVILNFLTDYGATVERFLNPSLVEVEVEVEVEIQNE